MKAISGTLIIMNDGEHIFVNHSKDEINNAIDEAIGLKRNYITITHLDRDIYFNYIRDKISKTRYLALPEPKKEIKELTNEERIERDEMISNMLEKTYENRKKNFMKERKDILQRLSKREKGFNLETTINKILDLNNFRKLKIQQDAKKTLQE